MNILEVRHLQKVYKSRFSSVEVEALRDVTFDVNPGEFVAVMGESGSGKTTLLNILATLDIPTMGEVLLNGQDMVHLQGKDLSAWRRNHLGFVFQDFSLLDTFSNQDNILLPLVLNQENYKTMMARLKPLAANLGISDLMKKYPYEISGGQKQRVAIARALITQPELLLADEPTGALDSNSSREVLSLFEKLNQQGQTIIMVTHSVLAASYASRVLFIQDGHIFHQLYRGGNSRTAFFEEISDTLTLMNARNGASHA